ncbi:MAG: twin-arginine translocase TatA/TatE family subunit [Pirellulales bacterium]|nr:twin-arginine translocase TatA/TatE family subunit [Pirellulales bacterium]
MSLVMLPLAFFNLGFSEMLLVAVIALLLYGSDLPEVARTWGKAYQEFRRHLNGIRNDLNDAIYAEPESPRRLQYYPEYHRDAVDQSAPASSNASAADGPVVAEVPAPPADAVAPGDDPVRHEAHGAA